MKARNLDKKFSQGKDLREKIKLKKKRTEKYRTVQNEGKFSMENIITTLNPVRDRILGTGGGHKEINKPGGSKGRSSHDNTQDLWHMAKTERRCRLRTESTYSMRVL